MQIDDDFIPSDEDVKADKSAEIDDQAKPDGDDIEDSPQHEEEHDASSDEEQDQDPEADEQPEEEQPPRKKSRTSRRFQELANKAKEAEERAIRAENALAALSGDDDGDFDEFDVDSIINKSSKATARLMQEHQVRLAKEDAARIEQEQTRLKTDNFIELATEFSQKVPDYEDAVRSLSDLPANDQVADLIISSEKGPEIAYYLGKHRDEARAVVNMPPLEAAKYIGGIEARLTASPARTTTKAPPPTPKLTGKTKSGVKSPENMSFAEYEKWRMGKTS